MNIDDEIVDIDLTDFGNVKEPKNDLIALIDADALAYTACLGVEVENMALPETFYSLEEWDEIINNPTYNEDEGSYWTIDLDDALERANKKIEKILDLTGCKEAELHFTGGRENFRYEIHPEYKANRKSMRTPTGLSELKKMLGGTLHTKWEADDIVVYLAKKNPEKYLLAATDKDVLRALPGRHFNYFEANYYVGTTHVVRDMHFMEVSEKDARIWPYIQCIDGDTSDNIKGPKGIGPKTMLKFFGVTLTKEEKATIKKLEHVLPFMPDFDEETLWNCVLDAYESKGMDEAEAKLNMNLVNMHLLEDHGAGLIINLWEGPNGCE